MKIVDVRITGLSGGTVDGGWPQGNKPEEDLNTLVEVITDEGLIGVGSAMTSKSLVAAAVDLLRPHLIGERADEPVRVTEKLRQATFWQGRGGAVEHAISGHRHRPVGSHGQDLPAAGQPAARRLLSQPHQAVRLDPVRRAGPAARDACSKRWRAASGRSSWAGVRSAGATASTDELLVRTARDTVGPDVELMVDAGGSEQFWPHGYKWALETAKMLADYDVVWFEEALPPDDLEGYIELRRHSPVPIATGEVLTRRQSFRPFLERQAVDIIQPDCTKCGGLTEAWRIAWMAYEHNIQWVPHGWNTAIGLAADLHLSAAMPVARYVEYLTPCVVPRRDHHRAVPAGRGGVSDHPGQAGPGHRTEPGGVEAVWPSLAMTSTRGAG